MCTVGWRLPWVQICHSFALWGNLSMPLKKGMVFIQQLHQCRANSSLWWILTNIRCIWRGMVSRMCFNIKNKTRKKAPKKVQRHANSLCRSHYSAFILDSTLQRGSRNKRGGKRGFQHACVGCLHNGLLVERYTSINNGLHKCTLKNEINCKYLP